MKFISLTCGQKMKFAEGPFMVLTEEEPSTDFGERMMPAIEWRRVSNLDILSLLLS